VSETCLCLCIKWLSMSFNWARLTIWWHISVRTPNTKLNKNLWIYSGMIMCILHGDDNGCVYTFNPHLKIHSFNDLKLQELCPY
jgi:hypothetical protein